LLYTDPSLQEQQSVAIQRLSAGIRIICGNINV
jgi:hypothetical protein